MGTLIYSYSGMEVTIDDRALAHLQIVIGAKLRRHEGFFVSWRGAPGDEAQRASIWLHPSIPIRFRFDGRHFEINRAWLEMLSNSANSPLGLHLVEEPPNPDHGNARTD